MRHKVHVLGNPKQPPGISCVFISRAKVPIKGLGQKGGIFQCEKTSASVESIYTGERVSVCKLSTEHIPL
jgi:hypothetical protein